MNELALFAGAGGILGGHLLGWRTRCAVEIDPYCRRVLLARQRDGMLPAFPIWDDITTFDGRPWRGSISVVTGGFPCQDISAAGGGAGLAGSRSGLFFEMLRVVGEVRPRFVFAENSPNLRTRGLATVVKEFDRLGYDSRWCVLGAGHIGAPHKRNRMWVLASDTHRDDIHIQQGRVGGAGREGTVVSTRHGQGQQMADTPSLGQPGPRGLSRIHREEKSQGQADQPGDGGWWSTEPAVGRVAHGVAHRVDRLRAIGNGQVPAVAALAWNILSNEYKPNTEN